MLVTVACEHSPLFLANVDSEGLLTLDYTVMQSVIGWYNNLTKPVQELAYFQQDALVFCFPEENGDWTEYGIEPDGTYMCPDWLPQVAGCPECLTYVPCDCEHRILSEQELQGLESYVLLTNDINMESVRGLIYTIRELEAQLKVEQEKL